VSEAADSSRLVDVGGKEVSDREAVAECVVRMSGETVARLVEGTPKGDPMEAARIAGLLAAKRTPELLPFCHPVALTGMEVSVDPQPHRDRIVVRATVRTRDRTGVEMEALTAAATGLLTVYDMCKSADRAMRIEGLRLLEKSGGKSGHFMADGSA
jgi:cyclic pyranopterin monophosphate synthase